MKKWVHCLLFLILIVCSCNENEAEPSCVSSVSEFTGSWNITEQCGTDEFSYVLAINEDSTGAITLHNLGEDGHDSVLNAILNGNSGFDIVSKTVQGVAVEGNGSLNGGCEQLVIQWFGWKGACTAIGIK